jgi:hypothetical protein
MSHESAGPNHCHNPPRRAIGLNRARLARSHSGLPRNSYAPITRGLAALRSRRARGSSMTKMLVHPGMFAGVGENPFRSVIRSAMVAASCNDTRPTMMRTHVEA